MYTIYKNSLITVKNAHAVILPSKPFHKKTQIKAVKKESQYFYPYKRHVSNTIGIYACIYAIPKIHSIIFQTHQNVNMSLYSVMTMTCMFLLKKMWFMPIPSLVFTIVYKLPYNISCVLLLFSGLIYANSKFLSFANSHTNSMKISLHELERFSPFLILGYIILTKNLKLLLMYGLNWYSNEFFKQKIFKKIMGDKTYPIIGRGIRPDGAMNCGYWSTGKAAISYGMPSKHAQVISCFVMYLYYYGNLSYLHKIVLLTSWVRLLVSRVEFGCHTPQQVMIGSILSFIIFYPFTFINKFF